MSARRFMDVVNWDTMVAPGVILCKDGSYLAGWQVGGIDTESVPPGDVQALRAHLAAGLSHLEDAHTFWVVWQRRPWTPALLLADTGHMALDMLADETNAFLAAPGQVWQDRLLMFLGWKPPGAGPLAAELEGFEAQRAMLESWFDPILSLTRIDPGRGEDPVLHSDLIRTLAALLGEDRPPPRLDTGALPVGLDALLCPALLQHGAAGPVHIGDHTVAVMSLSGEHEAYHPAPLERIQDLDLPLIWITRYTAMSQQTALAKARWIQKTRRQAGANMLANIEGGGGGERSLHADRQATRLEETKARIEGGEGYGDFLSVLLLHVEPGTAPDSPGRDVRRIRETVQLAGFALTEERTGAVPMLLSALPGHAMPTTREAMVQAQVMADLMPVRGLWPGSPTCPSPLLPPGTPALLPALTRPGELFHFNLHVDDIGHTLIFGPTGTGKSVLLGHLAAAWLRYRDAQVIVFDRGRSIRHACAALEGVFLEPGIGGAAGIAPLEQIARLGTPWALDWLSEMIRLGQNAPPGPEQAEALRSAVDLLAGDTDTSLNRLSELAQDQSLRRIFDAWLSGPYAGTFESQGTDVAAGLAAAPLTVFETHPLFEARESVAVLSLDYIFAEVARRFDGRPTLVVIDEAWFFLAHGIFVERIRYWLKEGRKMNVAVVLATQSVSDAAGSAIIADLLESCPTRLYLASPTAATEKNAPLYRKVGLDRTGIATVAGLRPKRELLMVQDRISRVLGFPLGPVALSILGRTGKTDSKRAAARAAHNPQFWMEDLADEEIIRNAMGQGTT